MPNDTVVDTTVTPTPEPRMSDQPLDRAPEAAPLYEDVTAPVETPPVDVPVLDAPVVDTPPAEPAYVIDLKKEVESMRAEMASLKGKPAETTAPATTYEPTPEQWGAMEKDFGFTVQEVRDAEGNVTKSLNVNPRQVIKSVFAQMENLAKQLRSEFDGRLSENTADSRMDRVYYDLEKRPVNPLSDIRQHSKEIKEQLLKFYGKEPQKWSDPAVLEHIYFSVVGMKSRQKPAAQARTDVRVIHPAGGAKPAPRPVGNGGISPQEREMMRGYINPKTGKQITDAEWLAARGPAR